MPCCSRREAGSWSSTETPTGVPRDVGRLAHWSLDIEYKSGATAFGRAEPDALVPDSSPTGVQSTIPLNQTGTVKGILVSVKIEHTYIGDLAVDLVTPSGASARPAEWHVSSGRLQARWSGPGGRASSPRHAESQRGRRGRVGDA